jgi:hypothetical protein
MEELAFYLIFTVGTFFFSGNADVPAKSRFANMTISLLDIPMLLRSEAPGSNRVLALDSYLMTLQKSPSFINNFVEYQQA